MKEYGIVMIYEVGRSVGVSQIGNYTRIVIVSIFRKSDLLVMSSSAKMEAIVPWDNVTKHLAAF
jgi:K+/H+ antiporter YhaU regulatory subunit KhtT